MKQIYFPILVLIFCLFLVSCGKSGDEINSMPIEGTVIAKTVYDDSALKKSAELCYFVGENTAGFNAYPLQITVNLQNITDTLLLVQMGYYSLSDYEEDKIVEVLETAKKETFYDSYLYYRCLSILEKVSTDKLQLFIGNHYSDKLKMYYGDSEDESLIENLTATLYCVTLCKENNIQIPHYEEVKNSLLTILEGNNYFSEPQDIQELYEAILNEEGTILKVLSYFFDDTSCECIDMKRYEDWMQGAVNTVLENSPRVDSIFELWIRNDIIDISKSFFNIDINEFKRYVSQLIEKTNYYHVGYSDETFCHDSQYLYEMAKLSSYFGLDSSLGEFIHNWIAQNIKTDFKRYVMIELSSRDTYYGVNVAKKFDMPLDTEKIGNAAYDWINKFILDPISSVEINIDGYYAVKTLNEIGVQLTGQFKIELVESIYNKLDTYKEIDTDSKFLALHELRILTDMLKELDIIYDYDLPNWVTDITKDALSISNYNIAEDVLSVYKYANIENSEYEKQLRSKIHLGTEDLESIGSSDQAIQCYYQIKKISIMLNDSIPALDEVFDSPPSNINLKDLSTVYYIIDIR